MNQTGPLTVQASNVIAEAAVSAGADRYLTFLLSGELYALPILDIVEIIEHRSLTSVPKMPPYIRGVLNLRGSVVPVVDLSVRFGRVATTIARRTSILIVETGRGDEQPGDQQPGEQQPGGRQAGGRQPGGRRTGVLVDGVNKVLHITAADIEPPPELGGDVRSDVVKGMARYDDQFIVILDLDRLLSGNRFEEFAATPDGSALGVPAGELSEAAAAGATR